MKSIVPVLVGLISAVIVIFFVELISHWMYPLPNGMDINNKLAMEEWIKTLPLGALLMVLLAWFLGAAVGGFAASHLDKENAVRRCTVLGAVLLGATIMNLLEIPHPAWMWAGGIGVIVVGVWLGFKIKSWQ